MEASSHVHHEHIPQCPKWVTWLLFGAAGLAVLVLALCAYVLSVYGNPLFFADYFSAPCGLLIFSCILLWVFVAGWVLLPRRAPHFYKKWAVLGFLGLIAFFWLVSWALMASRVSASSALKNLDSYYNSLYNSSLYSSSLYKRSPEPKTRGSSGSSSSSTASVRSELNKYSTAWKIAAVAAAMSAITWCLIVGALVFFTMACLAHQNSGAAGGEGYEGEAKPMPPPAPGQEMNNYGAPPSATPNPEQQFAHNQQYGGGVNQYEQPAAYNQNQQYQQPQHHIPT